MRSFRISAGTHSRAAARIGILGGALLVLLWIGISASSPDGAATAAPALGHAGILLLSAESRLRRLLRQTIPRTASRAADSRRHRG